MAQPTTAEGFKFWHDEVISLERPEKEVPYIPVIGLTAVYVSFNEKVETLTSYHWRQAVLQNDDARSGFRRSLQSFFKDRVDEDYDVPTDLLTPSDHAALQLQCAYESLMDGIPEGTDTVPENESFLAEQLGFARHDHGLMLDPLRLIEGGITALNNHYPRTAEFVGQNT